ncbi:MAG TPA: 50S ribosomal protein L31e [Candidatus Thermoplasmatota archaeon]|nr:50S ribosomal protein L31e [Candidatus Thermoplasmatota archaeon]
MAELERVYTIPLRDAYMKAPRPKRANRAVKEIKIFLARHMKSEEAKVWIDNPVNEAIWARGIQKPPRRIRVKAIRFDDGVVEVSLPEA